MFSDRTWEDNRKKKRGLPMLAALLCGCGVKDIEEQAEAPKNKGAFLLAVCHRIALHSLPVPCCRLGACPDASMERRIRT